jgi:hypothetical protein
MGCFGGWDIRMLPDRPDGNNAPSGAMAMTREESLSQALRELVGAVKIHIKQFEEFKSKQHKLLVEGQTFESASENWNEATQCSIDFQPLMDAIKTAEAVLGQEGGKDAQ